MNSMKQLAEITTGKNGMIDSNTPANIAVNEIYLDGKLKKAELIDEDEKSYGIFMHSLVLSNYAEVMKISGTEEGIVGDEYEKAIFHYAASKGFNKNFIETIAPKVDELTFEDNDNFKVSAHLINEKTRIVSKGTPEKLLRRCSYILLDSTFVKITRKLYKQLSSVLFEMLIRCKTVYAIAIKDISNTSSSRKVDNHVSDMTLVAFVGLGRDKLQSSF